jgi:hypothetical protein
MMRDHLFDFLVKIKYFFDKAMTLNYIPEFRLARVGIPAP